MKNFKSMSAFLLVLALLVTMIPTTAFATASLTGNTVNMSVGDNYTLPYTDTNKFRCSTKNSNVAALDGFVIKAKKIGNATVKVEKKKEHKVWGKVVWTSWKDEASYRISVNGNVTITYNVNGGNAPSKAMKETFDCLGSGKTYNVNSAFTATRDMDNHSTYVFLGWSKDKDADSASTKVTIYDNTTLYAVWKKVDNVVLADCYEGDTKIASNQKIVINSNGDEMAISDVAPQIEGKVFSDANVKVVVKGASLGNSTVQKLKYVKGTVFKDTPLKMSYDGVAYYGKYSIKILGKTLTSKTWQYSESNIKCYYTTPITEYTITANADTGGTISSPGAVTVDKDSQPTYTITPNNDYMIKTVIVNGSTVDTTTGLVIDTNGVGTYTFGNVTENKTIVVTFEKKPTIEYTADGYKAEYDGKAHGITVTATDAAIKYGTVEGIYTTENPQYKKAGENTVYFEITRQNYITATGSAIIAIDKKEMTVTTTSDSKVYDGTALTNNQITGAGIVTGDAITLSTNGTITNVGTTTNAAIITADEDVLANYDITKNEGQLTITKATLVITTASDSKVYDGTALTNNQITGAGIVTGDTITLSTNGTITNVGTTTNAAIITADEDVLANYDITKNEGQLTITKATLTITADSTNKRYDGTALTDSGWEDVAPKGLVDGDVILYVEVTGSALNVGTVTNSAVNTLIGRPYEDQPAISEEKLAELRSKIAEVIAAYDEGSFYPPLQPLPIEEQIFKASEPISMPLEIIIGNIIDAYYQNVTSNYDIEYVDGTLTITKKSSSHNKSSSSTTIVEEDVPLAGTPELNKVDHFNYVKGYEDGTVKAQNNITREEVATIFYRLLTDSSRAIYFSQEEDFSDIANTRWSLNAIATLANGGIIEGYNDGAFRATKPITRGEMAVIVSRFEVLEEVEGTNFSDTSGHWAESYINSAVKKGWIDGYSDGTFKPNQNITRAEAMTLINRVLERRIGATGLIDGYKVFPDNKPTDWFYYQVIEATNNHDYAERTSMSDMETWTKIKEDKTWTE